MKKLIASTIVAAGLFAVAAPAYAADPVVVDPNPFSVTYFGNVLGSGTTTTDTFTLAAGLYDFAVSLTANFGANTTSSVKLVGSLYKDGTTLIDSETVIAPGGPTNSPVDQLNLAAGNYSFKDVFTFTLVPVGLAIHAGSGISAVSAVPGPIAGAGLPALLGLLGFFGLRRRQEG